MLAFLIPIDAMDWQAEYDQLRHEIAEYSPDLAAKPHCVVFTKMDLLGEEYAPPIEAPGRVRTFCRERARAGKDSGSHRRVVDRAFAPEAKRETAGRNRKSSVELVLGTSGALDPRG